MRSGVHNVGVAPGSIIGGRYRLVEVLGSGGMGRVWKAYDQALRLDVAIKEVTIGSTLSDEARTELLTRAEHEARHAAQLRNHPNIVGVFDVMIEDEIPWTVMQFVPGNSLQNQVATDGPLSTARGAAIAEALLNALEVAHTAGIVHRDVKPANVLLTDEITMLTDFGIAIHESDTVLTQTGGFIGSMEFTAPERAAGEPGANSPASDLFSLGATLYFAVTGQSLFHRETVTATLKALLIDPIPQLSELGSLKPLITGLLDRDPSKRLTIAQARALLDSRRSVPTTVAQHTPAATKARRAQNIPTRRKPLPAPTSNNRTTDAGSLPV
ncbi:serine/threonine-protein kinase [Nocardia tengchongensis]|uniref:serine/threonine-protein kinase n=1 Tax=Nocardia tengchongensis TaxID=2055889 RepID=UPI003674A79E